MDDLENKHQPPDESADFSWAQEIQGASSQEAAQPTAHNTLDPQIAAEGRKEVLSQQNCTVEFLDRKDLQAFREVMISIIPTIPHVDSEVLGAYVAERTAEYYENALNNPDEWILLAAKDENGNIIGVNETKIIKLEDPERFGEKAGHIQFTNVDHDHQNQGIGTKLKASLEQALISRRIPFVLTSYRDENDASRAINDNFGFIPYDHPPVARKPGSNRGGYIKSLESFQAM